MVFRKIVYINQNITVDRSLDIPINRVNFVPDEVIVKTVSVSSPNSGAAKSFTVYSDLIEDFLFGISVGANSSANIFPNTTWRARGGNGIWNFRIRNFDESVLAVDGSLYLSLQLEFIKHE